MKKLGRSFKYVYLGIMLLFLYLPIIYLILFSVGIFGSKKLYKFTHNELLRGAITLNIAVTGIIYFTVLLPSSS